jgi:hypothetical protein
VERCEGSEAGIRFRGLISESRQLPSHSIAKLLHKSRRFLFASVQLFLIGILGEYTVVMRITLTQTQAVASNRLGAGQLRRRQQLKFVACGFPQMLRELDNTKP